MYSNSIVKIERCDGTVEDEPEVDPFMDISSLRSNVKVEVSEGALAHSSVDLKPELPIPPDQQVEEFHPGEFLQVKIEESQEAIKPETSESSDEDQAQNSSSENEDNAPMGKYEGVFFKDVMEEFTEKYKPSPSLLILLKSEPCFRFLPHFGSVRCEPCFLRSSLSEISSKKGYKFSSPISNAVFLIKQHISSMKHLNFTANSSDPKESTDFDETGIFTNVSILELIKSKFIARPSLMRILKSDMGGNQCLVYLPKQESLRCEVCYRSNVHARSQKYDFSRGIDGKRGLRVTHHDNTINVAQKIVDHFISDEHSAVVNQRKYLKGSNIPKRPKLSTPKSNAFKSGNSFPTPSNPLKASLHGSAQALPIKCIKSAVSIANKSTVPTPSSDGSSPIDPKMIPRLGIKSKGLIKLLIVDLEGDKCLRFIPNGSNLKNGAIRCETCYRDPTVIGCSRKLRGGLASKKGVFLSNSNINHDVKMHLNGRRHLECVKARNDEVDSGLVIAECSNSFILNGVKIEGVDSVEGSRDIEMDALDIKQELQDFITEDVKFE